MGIVLAIDYGTKKVGLAVTDPMKIIASGLDSIQEKDTLKYICDYHENIQEIEKFVIGLPKNMDGTPSESEPFILKFISKLEKRLSEIPIVRVDERFTSKMAKKSMIEMGMKKKKRQNKYVVDEISAVLILQNYLNQI